VVSYRGSFFRIVLFCGCAVPWSVVLCLVVLCCGVLGSVAYGLVVRCVYSSYAVLLLRCDAMWYCLPCATVSQCVVLCLVMLRFALWRSVVSCLAVLCFFVLCVLCFVSLCVMWCCVICCVLSCCAALCFVALC